VACTKLQPKHHFAASKGHGNDCCHNKIAPTTWKCGAATTSSKRTQPRDVLYWTTLLTLSAP